MANLVQGTGKIAMSKNYPVMNIGIRSGNVFGLYVPFNKTCAPLLEKKVIEQHDEIVRMVFHASAIVRLSRFQYQPAPHSASITGLQRPSDTGTDERFTLETGNFLVTFRTKSCSKQAR
tara:strand:- start:1095 stop:1451 length:357 start_codon:yes stop_codon:yes gene_type:complete